MTTKIIVFNGPPRSGKDSATDFAMKYLGKRGLRYRFAAPLKAATHAIFGLTDTGIEAFNYTKEIPNPNMEGMTPRNAYIWLSEEVLKPKFGRNFFGKLAVRTIKYRLSQKSEAEPIVVISDCGFIEEVQCLIEAFGAENVNVVHLYRPDTNYSNDSRGYVDAGIKHLVFNNSDLTDLKEKVIAVVNEIDRAK
jgi:hypothetical protein